MEDNAKDFVKETKDLASDYVEARWKLFRLNVAGKAVHALGVFMAIIIAAMLGFFVVLFLGMLLAFWISDLSGSVTLGFSVTALLFIILFAIVLLFRKKLILLPVSNLLIRELAEEIDPDDEVLEEETSPEDDCYEI